MKVRFHLPDFSGSFKLNLLFAEMLKNHPEFFREGVEIASFYGVFPPCLWNGGRSQGGNTDKNYMKAVIKEFNDRGIPLRFTFTNVMLEKKHLSDERCNMMLHLANNGMNEVIVASQLLEDYIRREFPKYKITSSTCKRLDTKEALISELEKDYHVVVADYDLNNRFDILEELPRKKDVELLVNACCQPECQGRAQHYKDISQQQIAFCNHIKKYPNVPFDLEKYDLNSSRIVLTQKKKRRLLLESEAAVSSGKNFHLYELVFSGLKIRYRYDLAPVLILPGKAHDNIVQREDALPGEQRSFLASDTF